MPILNPPGQLRPDPSDPYGLLALVSNVNNYSVNLVNVTQSGINVTLTGPQAISGVVRLTGAASNNFTVTLPPTPRLIDALGPTIAKDGSFAVPISIQNEDPTFTANLTPGDSLTTINGTAQVVAGTRRIWLLTVGTPYDPTVVSIQNIGTFSTTAITVGGGSVTSVGQTVPPEFTISGSPVTTAGTLAIGKANETANTVWAGPTSGGVAPPTFRPLVIADIPGGVGTGTVTSVGLSMPAEFSVAGTPVTTTGTLAVTKATESANTVWAGPTSGAPAQPAFRALVAADLPSSLNLSQTFITQATEATLSNSRVLTAGSNITITDGGPGSTITIASSSGGGKLQSQIFTSSGSWTAPSGVTGCWISGSGGGGGGASLISAQGGGGGGGGEECVMQPVSLSALEVVTVTIGAAGAGATAGASNTAGGNGGTTTFGTHVTLLGGNGGLSANTGGGYGGGPQGGKGAGTGPTGGTGLGGFAESPTFFGGSGAGSGGQTGAGGVGAGYGGTQFGGAGGAAVSSQGGGGGGASSSRGIGGAGGNGGVAGSASPSLGAGGGGAGGLTGGSLGGGAGGAGWLAVFWVG